MCPKLIIIHCLINNHIYIHNSCGKLMSNYTNSADVYFVTFPLLPVICCSDTPLPPLFIQAYSSRNRVSREHGRPSFSSKQCSTSVSKVSNKKVAFLCMNGFWKCLKIFRHLLSYQLNITDVSQKRDTIIIYLKLSISDAMSDRIHSSKIFTGVMLLPEEGQHKVRSFLGKEASNSQNMNGFLFDMATLALNFR